MFDNDIIIKSSSRRYINDIYLLAALFFCAGLIWVLVRLMSPDGNSVRISCLDEGTGEVLSEEDFSLSEDGYIVCITPCSDEDKGICRECVISPLIRDEEDAADFLEDELLRIYPESDNTLKLNDLHDISSLPGHINIISIHDNKAEMISATCPDKICVHTKAAGKKSESIICLPHRLTVYVISDNDSKDSGNEPDALTW